MPNGSGAPKDTLGRYRLNQEIVSGGMGVVRFGSVDEGGRSKVVAIKQLNPSLVSEPEAEAAFLKEAGLAVRIHHENVVPTLEVGVHRGELFVVMEYLHGESLARLMKASRRPAPPPIASRIVSDVLQGLAAVHDARDDAGQRLGVVHRDVSPHNVLVGANGTSFVIDFGVAKVAGEATNTKPGMVKGKLSYMSPEQIAGREVTPATDLFAAAVVLWETLTGVRLFASGSVGSLMRRIAEGRIEPPSTHDGEIGTDLDDLVLRGLHPDPAHRFDSATSFAEHLARVVPPASRDEVAAWVQRQAGETLEERAAVVRAIEGRSSGTGRAGEARQPRPLPWRSLLAVAAVASLLGILAGVAFFAGDDDPSGAIITSTPTSEVVGTMAQAGAASAGSLPPPCASKAEAGVVQDAP